MSRYPRTILGTCCVPWNEDGTFAEEIFRHGVRALIKSGLPDLYLFGTAGEGYAVTDSQFDAIVRAFTDEMTAHNARPMVGVIALALGTMIERIERAHAMGVRHYQISLPSWGALSDVELFAFFKEICDRFADCQFLHYNLMRTKRYVTAGEYARLAEAHPNLVATKHGTTDLGVIGALMAKAPQLRHFITEGGYAYGSLVGEPGFLISICASNPARAREYFEAGVARDTEKLGQFEREIGGMSTALMSAVGATAHMDGAYDKIFCRLHDPRFPLRLLPPYQGTTEAAFTKYKAVLEADFPQWLDK